MQHLDEGMIHAWLDGALSEAEGREIEHHAAGCATCSAAIAEARGLIAGSSRIVAKLDGGSVIPSAPSVIPSAPSVIPSIARDLSSTRKWRKWPIAALAAAVLVFAVSLRQRDDAPKELTKPTSPASSIQAPAPAPAESVPTPPSAARPAPSTPIRRVDVAESPKLPPTASTRAAAPAPAPVANAPVQAPVVAQRAATADQPMTEQRAAVGGGAGADIARRAASRASEARRQDLAAASSLAAEAAPRPPARLCWLYRLDAAVDPLPQSFVLDFPKVLRVGGDSISGLSFRMSGDSTSILRGSETIMTLVARDSVVTGTAGSKALQGLVTRCR